MSGTKPGNQGRLVQLHQQTNPFDRYKKQFNKYQEKTDPEYQRQLRKIQKDTLRRFEGYSQERNQWAKEHEEKRQKE